MECTNALEELAERLKASFKPILGSMGATVKGRQIAKDVRRASCIVAELAKYGDVTPPFLNMKSVFEKCREIAEKGKLK